MVGYTPSLSTAVWVGTVQGDKPLVTASGSEVYGSGLPSDIWKATMDGALKGTSNETFPKPIRDRWLCGRSGAAAETAAAVGDRHPAHRRSRTGHHHSGRAAHDDHGRAAAAGGTPPGGPPPNQPPNPSPP